ncbi:hypothetical protein KIN20_002153 [Parelaphostrongylus tenuis]|uniref:Uncharacterized protein n=1 Tax=Parelaphostrongylus tenuis TaxID=148309 RepID=A0AAD5QCU0_PARTN|nr:hypothetical protein KIN20_002153 [Parelaphostrongylus tenuis]
MNVTSDLHSERLGGLLSALLASRQPQPQQSNGFGAAVEPSCSVAYSGQQSINRQDDSEVVVETVPELLDFVKSSTSPRKIRDVVKVREKIEEEKRKKRESQMSQVEVNRSGTTSTFERTVLLNDSLNGSLNNHWIHDVSVSSASSAYVDQIAQPSFQTAQPFYNTSIGSLSSNHGYAGFEAGVTPVTCIDGTVSSASFQKDIVQRTPLSLAVMSAGAADRPIMPGAPVMPRLSKQNCPDVEVIENCSAKRQESNDDGSLETPSKKKIPSLLDGLTIKPRRKPHDDERKCPHQPNASRHNITFEEAAKKAARESPKKISSLFESLQDESVGKTCCVQQYAHRHHLPTEEAERKEEKANEIVGTRVTKRSRRKKRKSRHCERLPLPEQRFAKNYEDIEKNHSQLDCNGTHKQSSSSSPCPEDAKAIRLEEAGCEEWSASSSNCDDSGSNVRSDSERLQESWPPAYPGLQAVIGIIRRKQKKAKKRRNIVTASYSFPIVKAISSKWPADSERATTASGSVLIQEFGDYEKNIFYEDIRRCLLRQKLLVVKRNVFPAEVIEEPQDEKDVVCLDHSRVVLKLESPPCTNYIHANWVRFENLDRVFIATQAPLENTIEDFWRMIFQEQCCAIINLTNDLEDKDKIVQYFPPNPGGFANYGMMFVNTKKVDDETKFLVYTLEVLPDGCANSLLVKLVKTKSESGKSPSIHVMSKMLRIVASIQTVNTDPIVVHCVSGVGRAVSIILIDAILHRLLFGQLPVD